MTTTTNTQEMLRLEKQFWDAMKRKDADAAARMTADGAVIVGAQGVSAIDRQTMARLTKEGNWTIERYEIDESTFQARMLTEDVAAVAYSVTEHITVEGQPLMLMANDASVWLRLDGDWLCAMHTESIAGDPYGRDRKG
jgi:hypothetical protein